MHRPAVFGAHAPGQVDLNLDALGVDFYVGNCHKWLSAPKGSGFLFARPEVQELLDPLVISWGWKAEPTYRTQTPLIDHFEWGGTDDPAAYLSVPADAEVNLTKSYFAGIYTPDWDGGYDVDRYPSYGPDW